MLTIPMGPVRELAVVCRHELCPREELHAPHVVSASTSASALHQRRQRRPRRPRASQPWLIQDPVGLQAAVYGAIATLEARTFGQIRQHVQDDYGTCSERSVHRHLRRLEAAGQIVRVRFSQSMLAAYVRTGSKLIADPDYLYEEVLAAAPPFQKGFR